MSGRSGLLAEGRPNEDERRSLAALDRRLGFLSNLDRPNSYDLSEAKALTWVLAVVDAVRLAGGVTDDEREVERLREGIADVAEALAPAEGGEADAG